MLTAVLAWSMARFLLLVLVACSVVPSLPCQPLACSTAGCQQVTNENTPCNDISGVHHEQMRTQCCASATSASATSSTRNCSCSASFSSSSSSPTSTSLTLSPRPINCTHFSLTISWDRDLSGGSTSGGLEHKLYVYEATISGREFCLQCFRIRESETSITIPSIPFDGRWSKITLKLVDHRENEVIVTSSIHRENCYTLYNDPDTRKKYCGPKDSESVDMNKVQVQSLAAKNGLVDASISWKPPNDAGERYMYYLVIKNTTDHDHLWSANTTSVLVRGFNSSLEYTLTIFSIIECAGVYIESLSWQPCAKESTHFTLPPATSATPVSTPCHSCRTTPYPTTVPTPSTMAAADPQQGREKGMTFVLAVIAVPVAVVLAVLLALLVIKLRKPHTDKPPPPSRPEPDEDAKSTTDSSSSIQVYLQDTFPMYVTDKQASALILYSLESPEEEVKMVMDLLVGGLAHYKIHVEAPGLASPRDVNKDWVEGWVKKADAVLLFCNQQFYKEWTTSSRREGEYHVGYWVRQLKNNVNDLSNFAYVYMEKTDRQYSELSNYIGKRFCIAKNKTIDIKSIAQFVWNTPSYRLRQVCVCVHGGDRQTVL